MKIFLTILMFLTGLLGLGATACGVFLLGVNDRYIDWQVATVIGIVPGVLLLVLANWLWGKLKALDQVVSPPSSNTPTTTPPFNDVTK